MAAQLTGWGRGQRWRILSYGEEEARQGTADLAGKRTVAGIYTDRVKEEF